MATATAMELQEAADAKMSSRQDTLAIIESLTLALLKEVARDADPSLSLVMYPLDPIVQNMMTTTTPAQTCRAERNVVRDERGHTHLGTVKTNKSLFAKKGLGAERFAKSE